MPSECALLDLTSCFDDEFESSHMLFPLLQVQQLVSSRHGRCDLRSSTSACSVAVNGHSSFSGNSCEAFSATGHMVVGRSDVRMCAKLV